MIELTPALKPTTTVKISDFGRWQSSSPKVLHDLAVSLNINLDNPQKLELTAIPDMWARPILFKTALFDETHVIHKRIVAEWRGLLAILALKDILNLNVTAAKVDIASNNNDFALSLRKLLPKEVLESSLSWTEHFIIRYMDEPIGMTSPVTLVCTAAEYKINDVQKVSWVDMCNGVTFDTCGDRLTDPVQKLDVTKKTLIAGWLDSLKSGLIKLNLLKDVANPLFMLLDQFIQDLGGTQSLPVKYAPRELDVTGLYRLLGRGIAIKPDDIPQSSMVKLIREKQNNYPDLLLVNDTIAEQWGVKPHDIIVNNLSHLGLKISSDNSYNNQQLPNNTKILDTDRLFTKKLHVIAIKSSFPGAFTQEGVDLLDFEGDDITPILPIQRGLLNYFTPITLSSRIRFEQHGNDIKCILNLPLTGISGEGQEFKAERIYSASDGDIVSIAESPIFSVWPNFKSDSWKLYYVYFSTQRKIDNFNAKPYITGQEISPINLQSYQNGERVITQLNGYPEAFLCSYKNEDAGLILPREPDVIQRIGSKDWKIGIDFGTTGTNVYYVNGTSPPEKVTFKNRYSHISVASESGSDIYDYCFHNEDQTVPFLTIYRDALNDQGQQNYRPLLDGNIYLMKHYDDSPNEGILVENLKWGHNTSANQMKLLRAFIKQLCIQTLAESATQGCTSVQWLFSYPASFSTSHAANFEGACNLIIDECVIETGISSIGGDIKCKLESVVAANYFHNCPGFGGLFACGALCIDIGGGTSDISLWQDCNLINQTSIKFAGRSIFNNLIASNTNLMMKLFGLESNCKLLGIDVYNRDFSSVTFKALGNYINEPDVQELLKLLFLGISSIFYYTGLIVAHKISNQEYSAKQYPPEIFVAGGGANILHWIAGGKFNNDHPTSNLLKKIFISAAKLENYSLQDFKIQISQEPKSEAAQGLVYESALKADRYVLSPNRCLSGESFTTGVSQHEWFDEINVDKLSNGIEASHNLPKLKEFLQLFNICCQEYGFKPISNIEQLLKSVAQSLPAEFIKYKNISDASKVEVEPIFILAFKKLWDTIVVDKQRK